MLCAIVVLFAVCFVEAVFIGYIVKKAAEIIDELERKLYEPEPEEKAPVNKTAAAVQRIWEVEL